MTLGRHPLYRLQNTIFAMRRYLPTRLRQLLKPVYRRWWQRSSQRQLAAALASAQSPTTSPSYAIFGFSAIDWEFRFQRPQQLLSRLALLGHPVYYLRTDFGSGQSIARLESLAPSVFGLRLPGPSTLDIYGALAPPGLINLWVQLLDDLVRSQGIEHVLALVQAPFWAPR